MEPLFAKGLSEALEAGKITSEAIAKKIGCSRMCIENIRSGKTIPSGVVVKALCDFLRMNYPRARLDVAIDSMHRKFGDAFLERTAAIYLGTKRSRTMSPQK
jgi:DNA-binding XRE family transcriptional regulator